MEKRYSILLSEIDHPSVSVIGDILEQIDIEADYIMSSNTDMWNFVYRGGKF